ncbi:AraC family transcriptional regulator [Streptomyces sp. NPDC050560]|uniref:AraC family transcriptional regulator n=1 Tax=Streptomyces sp. NPDC050560 TaxID=3365630 RepID=UPI00378C9A56
MPEIRHVAAAPAAVRALGPGQSIDAHRHDEHQIVYAGSGVVAVTTDAGTWFAPGTRAIWVPAGCVHAHRAHGHLALHLIGLPRATNPLALDGPAVLDVSPLLRELILAYTGGGGAEQDGRDGREGPGGRDGPATTPQRRRLRAVLLDQLRTSPRPPVHHLPTPADPRLRTVCALLRRHPDDPRTLAALAAEAGAGERTLSRLFRSELGMTFPQWRTQLRLYHALRMLADGLPVTTVAHRCGWASASAFIDVFHHAFGHTPGSHHHRTDTCPQLGRPLRPPSRGHDLG